MGNAVEHMAALAVALIATACSRPHLRSQYAIDVDWAIARHSKENSTRRVPAPASLEPRPWKIGQWARYMVRTPGAGGDRLSIHALRVLAEDSCGIWIEFVAQDYEHRSVTTMCFSASAVRPTNAREVVDRLQIVISERNEDVPIVYDFRDPRDAAGKRAYEAVAWNLVVPSFVDSAELPREDVDVLAGHIAGTIRRTSVSGPSPSLALWSHPDVPFDATVKATFQHGVEHVLLDFGDKTASVMRYHAIELTRALTPKPRPRTFIGLGLSLSRFTRTANQVSNTAPNFSFRSGSHLTPSLALVGRGSLIVGAEYAPDPTQTQDAFRLLMGIRWAPFHPGYFGPREETLASRFSIEAALGYAELKQGPSEGPSETVGRGHGRRPLDEPRHRQGTRLGLRARAERSARPLQLG